MSLSAYFLVTFEHEKAEVPPGRLDLSGRGSPGGRFSNCDILALGRQAGGLDFDAFRRSRRLQVVQRG